MEAAAEKRLEAASIELGAARRCIFVGSSNNDRPRYMQRTDQLEQQVSNLAQTLKEHDQRMVRLNRDLAEADIIAPAEGSVWEILTAPEEPVRVGQNLVRVLDCGHVVVTAIVNEGVYNRLQVGSLVRFQPRGGREDLPGTVVRLRDMILRKRRCGQPTRRSSAVSIGSAPLAHHSVPEPTHDCNPGRLGHGPFAFRCWMSHTADGLTSFHFSFSA
jgi:hypothetical protein